jgi:tetratricopeptide (TPR) repeat protein
MKTVFKFLSLGMMLMVFAVAPAFAQEECEGLYKKWLDNYKGTVEQKQMAVTAGEEFIAKCNTPEQAEIIKYLQVQVPKLKKTLESGKTIDCFNNAVKDAKNVNGDNAFRCGKEILASNQDQIDVPIVLASIGFDKAVAKPPVDTYNAEAINYAKQAIQKIEAGKTSTQYGAYGFTYTNKDNALAWMNYTIGYIMYFNQKNKKDALPYLYKATRYETNTKNNPKNIALIYQAIGDYYRDEYNRLDDERAKLVTEAKDKTPEEVKVLADKSKELLLLQKGYADRMIDAYGRAYNLSAADKPYQAGLLNDLKVIF